MKRKLYSVEYIKQLKKEAKRPVEIQEEAKRLVTSMVMFMEHKELEGEFEQYIKDHEPEIVEMLEEG